jgi:glutathione S-transferase
MITLYSARLSLFAKKVEIALAEKGLDYNRILVPFDQSVGYSPKHPEVLAANPKGQVPVLIDGDLVLYDSTIIIEYLDEAYPHMPLLPRGTSRQDAQARAQCRLLDLFADEVMLVPLRAFMHRTGPRPENPSRWTELEQMAAPAATTLSKYFAQLDAQLEGRSYLCEAFSIADIAVFMAVLYAQRLGGPGLSDYPSLASWYRAMHQRPAFAKVAAEVAEADRDLSAHVDGAYPDAGL